ncbi:MAG: FAD-dependent thymidylate synthase [Okeania sp. SIO3H1]|nr:FAD-dependent thymidylate synthase [Okeania sp. SIO3H1]
MSDAFNVLNHGLVRLVDHMGNDLSIVRSARVSYDAEWRTGEDAGKDAKLINYLLKNRHTSPFEQVKFTFEVKAPIFIFRQWHRHRTWSYNEVSARYSQLPEEFYVPELEQITTQHSSNKQMRTDEQNEHAQEMQNAIFRQCTEAFDTYKKLIEDGYPRELARSVLPVGTYSHMFASVDLHNLFHFLMLRLHPHAQYEIRVFAEAMLKLIEPIVPVAVEAFNKIRKEIEGTKLMREAAKKMKGDRWKYDSSSERIDVYDSSDEFGVYSLDFDSPDNAKPLCDMINAAKGEF